MALRFCDSVEHYTTVTNKWDYNNSCAVTTSNARFPNKSSIYASGTGQIFKYFDSQQTWIVGWAWRPYSGLGANAILCLSSGSTAQLTMAALSNGTIDVRRGNGDGPSIGTSSKCLTSTGWVFLEAKVYMHSSAGTVDIHVNGQSVLALTGANTQWDVASANRVGIGSWTNGDVAGWYATDFYICDTSGSRNTTFLGDIRVQSILPTADGGTNEWTASAGNRWECVDDPAMDSVTDYISEDTAGQKNTFAFGNVTPTSGTVKGTQILIAARKDDAGSRSIAPVYGNGTPASDVDGATVSVGDSYIYYTEIKEQDPVAVADWTIASVNAAEFGVRLVS